MFHEAEQQLGEMRSTYRQLATVEDHLDTFSRAGDIICTPRQQRHCVTVQRHHLKFGQIRLEGDARVVVTAERLDFGLTCTVHVVVPRLQNRSTLK